MIYQTPPPHRYCFEKLSSLLNNDYAALGSLAISVDRNHFYTKDGFHTHDYYELGYIRSGEGVQVINGTAYPVSRGDVMLFRLHDFHAYHSFSNMEVVNYCIRPDLFAQFAVQESLFTTVIHISDDSLPEFESLLSLLHTECRKKRDLSEDAIRYYLHLVFLFMKRNCCHPSTEEKRWDDLFVYLSQNYASVTLGCAAQQMYLSKNYFCRIFRKKTGSAFLVYINHLKIAAALEMLRNTSLSVQEIWKNVGFHQAKQFYSLFKQETGMTPQQFRRQCSENG